MRRLRYWVAVFITALGIATVLVSGVLAKRPEDAILGLLGGGLAIVIGAAFGLAEVLGGDGDE